MMKIYGNVCYKYRKVENLKISYISKKHLVFLLLAVSVVINTKKN